MTEETSKSDKTYKLWRIGFQSKGYSQNVGSEEFFRLHCPTENVKRLALCEIAMQLLGLAWPHLINTSSLVTKDGIPYPRIDSDNVE